MEMRRKENGSMSSVPAHLALIPDGNRRWASTNGKGIINGYALGIKKFVDFSLWLKAFGVRTLTVWALSLDNIEQRKSMELNILYDLYIKASKDKKLLDKLEECGAKVNVIGKTEVLPKKVREALESVERRTREYKDFTINLLVAYGGRADLIEALKKAAVATKGSYVANITEENVKNNLMTASIPDADLIIRTSGEKRLSGFLPWQSNYSELYFSKKYWPDFGRTDLKRALVEFSDRHRRFGK
jgi:undecaprenyl diphosphate synthase